MFYGYRQYSTVPNGNYLYATDALNGWYSFETADTMLQHTSQYNNNETAVSAAEYLDGYSVGVDANSTIFAMKAGDWNRIALGTLELAGRFIRRWTWLSALPPRRSMCSPTG